MLELETMYAPVRGKTYSLFGDTGNTCDYYLQIGKLADECLQQCPDISELLAHVQKISGKKRFLKRQLREKLDHSLTSFIIHTARSALSTYTAAVQAHLKDISIYKRGDSTLLTSEEQYHLYMLEIELANRIHTNAFSSCAVKLAFLPHCLRDLDVKCHATQEPGDIDYACKGCSKTCFINRASTLLRTQNIKPYLWMDADLKAAIKDSRAHGVSVGVLGVACVPELVDGMRLCMRAGVPVIGTPLNANRCGRWMEQPEPTSINLEALDSLLCRR